MLWRSSKPLRNIYKSCSMKLECWPSWTRSLRLQPKHIQGNRIRLPSMGGKSTYKLRLIPRQNHREAPASERMKFPQIVRATRWTFSYCLLSEKKKHKCKKSSYLIALTPLAQMHFRKRSLPRIWVKAYKVRYSVVVSRHSGTSRDPVVVSLQ